MKIIQGPPMMDLPLFLSFLFLVVHLATVTATENDKIVPFVIQESECSCPNYTLIFECIVIRNNCTIASDLEVSVYWSGSVFNNINCDSITLSSLISLGNPVYCNEGAIAGSIMSNENNSCWYTSQLKIILNFEIIGKNVLCLHGNLDNLGQDQEIGNSKITVDIHLFENDPVQNLLYFGWNSSLFSHCSVETVQYNFKILATNCGNCPNTTNYTTAVCTDVPTSGGMCNFTVKIHVCGRFIGSSQPYLVQLENAGHDSVLLPILIAGILLLIAVLMVGATVFLWFLHKRYRTFSNRFSQSSATATVTHQAQSCSAMYDSEMDDHRTTTKVFDNKLASGIYGSKADAVPRASYEDYIPTNGEGKLELENVLVYLRGRVTFQWYKFGAALGVPSNVLEKFIKDSEKYSEEKALNKVLRYWLKNHPTQPSWQEVSNALRDIIWMS